MTAILQIRVFGGMEIQERGEPVRGFLSAKTAALFVYLVLEPHEHMRNHLAGLFWSELSEDDARNNLRQALTNLRKLLGAYLATTRTTVAFRSPDFLWVDALAFEQHFEAAAKAANPLPDLQAAAACYAGDFLAGTYLNEAPLFEEWMLSRRARYRELALHTLHTLTGHYLQQRDCPRAIASATRLLALDPWREEAYRQLMLALAYDGQYGAALKQYAACKRVLETELGVPPSMQTSALYQRILIARDIPRHTLPAPNGTLIGREPEVTRITAWLAAPDAPLLTITGPGGCGKTRLALHVLAQAAHAFLEGAWFVPLESAPADTSVAAAIGDALGFSFSGEDQPETQLLTYLLKGERLLVLDNMEHLLSERNLSFLARLLQKAPQIKVLCTSRERLGLHREQMLPLSGLPCPKADASPEAVRRSPAARLFLQSACRSQPEYALDGQETALVHLCHLLDGLPLALELAAAWVSSLDVADIARRIANDTDFLSTDWRDVPTRHRSARAVFEHSWQLLSPQEQDIYARLSVFRGGFTLEAAEQVAGATLSMLTRLGNRSLLRRTGKRYTLHPLLRQFAAEKLGTQRETTITRHARYFGTWLQREEAILLGGRLSESLQRVRPELENLRLAWETAVRQRDTRIINQMADSFMLIFDLSGLYRDILEMAQQAIEALEGHVDVGSRENGVALGRVYGLRSIFRFRLGAYQQAWEDSERALALLSPFRPHIAYGHTLVYQGAAAYGLGDFSQVVTCWQQAVEAYRAAGSTWGECTALSNLAESSLAMDDLPAAEQYASRARALALQMENAELTAVNEQILAVTALQRGDLDAAATLATQAVAHHRQVNNQAHTANALAILARVVNAQGDSNQALSHLQESVAILRQLDNRLYLQQRLYELGQVALHAGRLRMAESALYEALSLANTREEEENIWQTLWQAAQAYQQHGYEQDARRLAQKVIAADSAPEDVRGMARALLHAANLATESMGGSVSDKTGHK